MNVINLESPHKSLAEDGLVKLTQAASYVGIHRATLYDWIRAGHFPKPTKINGKNYYRLSTLKGWLNHHVPEAKFDRQIVTL